MRPPGSPCKTFASEEGVGAGRAILLVAHLHGGGGGSLRGGGQGVANAELDSLL